MKQPPTLLRVVRVPSSLACRLLLLSLVPTAFFAKAAFAQGARPGTPADSTPQGSPQAQAPVLPFAFSGVLYANFQYGGARGNRSQNRFDVERAYLNFRARAGERDSIRVTLDVFQQRDTTRDSYYRGWVFRAKYAFLQHEFLRGSDDAFKINAKLGLIQTVVIDKEEQFWPRGLSPVAVEQAGYFSSADAGLSSTITLPSHAGEVYATIVNGTNYTSRELDRFKDYAARLTLSPFSNASGFLKGVQLSPWFSKGDRASDFARQRGTVRPVSEGRQRDRYGLLLTGRDPRLTLGAHLARRVDVIEQADTTVATVPAATTRTGSLWSLFGILRPFAFTGASASPFWVVLRVDQVKPNVDSPGYQRFLLGGLSWDFSTRTSLTLDYQAGYAQQGLVVPDTKTVFLHLIANF